MSNRLGKRKRRERENLNNPQPALKPFEKGWYKKQDRIDRDNFEAMSIFMFVFLCVILWVIFDYDNPEVHKVLLYSSVMMGLLSMLYRGDIKSMFTGTKKVYTSFSESNLNEIEGAIFLKNLALSAFAILFIVDLEILSNAGMRIGVAGATWFFYILGLVIKSFWRR